MIGDWMTTDVSEVSPRLISSPPRSEPQKTWLVFSFSSSLWGNPCGKQSVCCEQHSISPGWERWESAMVLDRAGGWHNTSACTHLHTQMDTHSRPVCTNEGGRWRVWCMSLWADREGGQTARGEGPPRNLMAWSNGNSYWINNLHAEQTGPVGRLNRQTGADSSGAAGYSSSPCQLIGQQL